MIRSNAGLSNVGKPAGAVAEAVERGDAHVVEHVQIEIAHRRFRGLQELPRIEAATAVSGDDDRKVRMGVAVSIRISAAVNDHGVVEDRVSVGIFFGFQRGEEPGELRDVEAVDLGDFLDHILFVAVVGKRMVAFGNADFSEGSVASIMC